MDHHGKQIKKSSLKIQEGGKFLRIIFNVNHNCAEDLFINILLCYMYTFHIVITKLCKFVAEIYKKKVNRKVQEEPQAEAAAKPRH